MADITNNDILNAIRGLYQNNPNRVQDITLQQKVDQMKAELEDIYTKLGGTINVALTGSFAKKEYNNVTITSLFYSWGDTQFVGSTSGASYTNVEPFPLCDYKSVSIEIENQSDIVFPSMTGNVICLYKSKESGEQPFKTFQIPSIPAGGKLLIVINDSPLDISDYATHYPRLSAAGVTYRRSNTGVSGKEISVRIWGSNQ